MEGIIPDLSRSHKRRLEKMIKGCKDAKLKTRLLIVLNLAEGRSPSDTARAQNVSRNTVYRIASRFKKDGIEGCIDHREGNGNTKLTDEFLSILWDVVKSSPLSHGWKRPTWTREMLVKTIARKTGTEIHVATMSKALGMIGARRGRPKPVVETTWSKRAKNRRLRELQELLDQLPDNEELVYEDEVDIHLNPKIGLDWMVSGQQKETMTPGQNVKRYLAGALNARSGELLWVEGEKKNDRLFIELLWQLQLRYPDAKRIHVILDNYSIHSTQEVERSLKSEAGKRIQLHFLPPYCPDHNKIERTWQDLHANVTRNHKCADMMELMENTHAYLRTRSKELKTQYALAA